MAYDGKIMRRALLRFEEDKQQRRSRAQDALISVTGAVMSSFMPLDRVQKDNCRSPPPAV